MLTKYILSRSNEILSVGEGWDDLAAKHGGPVASEVIGRPLFDFVAGAETVSYLNAIFFSCRRSGQSFTDVQRVDYNGTLRFFEMTIVPRTRGELEVSHLLVDQRQVPSPVGLRTAAAATKTKCTVCCRSRRQGVWLALEVNLFKAENSVDYVVCPDCRARASTQIAQTTLAG